MSDENWFNAMVHGTYACVCILEYVLLIHRSVGSGALLATLMIMIDQPVPPFSLVESETWLHCRIPQCAQVSFSVLGHQNSRGLRRWRAKIQTSGCGWAELPESTAYSHSHSISIWSCYQRYFPLPMVAMHWKPSIKSRYQSPAGVMCS